MSNTRKLSLAILLFWSFTGAELATLETESLLPGYGQTDAHLPSIAIGNTNGLVVWQAGVNEKSAILGMRIDRSGRKIDSTPFIISDAVDAQERPRVSFGYGRFFVVWNDLRNNLDYDVYGARVTTEGQVLDVDGIAVAAGARNQCDPVVCPQNSGFYVVWRTFQRVATSYVYGNYILASRHVDSTGTLSSVDTIPFVSMNSLTETNTGSPEVISMGENKALLLFPSAVSSYIRIALGIRLIQDGKPVSANIFAQSLRTGSDVSIGFDGVNALAVWSNFINGGGRGGAANGGMGFFTAANITVPTLSNPYPTGEWGNRTKVVWDGFSYVAVWQRTSKDAAGITYSNTRARLFSKAGAPEDAAIAVAGVDASPVSGSALASDGNGRTFVVYERHPSTPDVPIKIAIRTIVNPAVAGTKLEMNRSNNQLKSFTLTQNPFAGSIRIVMADAGNVKLAVYDSRGRLVRVLINGVLNKGAHQTVWNGEDFGRQRVSSGVYFIQFSIGRRVVSIQRMVVLG